MMRTILIAALASAIGASGNALAQGPAGAPARPGRIFDPSTVQTVSGEVTGVRKVQGRRNAGVHVDLKTAEAVLDVHVGPASFLASKNLQLEKGDQLEVKGSKVELGGKPALIAQTVKKGDTTVTLRDANGIPAWSRARAR